VTNCGVNDKSADELKDPPQRQIQMCCYGEDVSDRLLVDLGEGPNRRCATGTLSQHDVGMHQSEIYL